MPEDVELFFTPQQANYFLTTPFFEPFKVVQKSEEKTVVRLRLIPYIDLVRKLGSLGKDVKVLKPAHLAEEMVKFHKEALAQYEMG